MNDEANDREFATIALLILQRGYSNFPMPGDTDFNLMAQSMGLHNIYDKLDSGRAFYVLAGGTLKWLVDEGYVRAKQILPKDSITLAEKGYVAMNKKSPISGISFGKEIEQVTQSAGTAEGRQKIAEIVGSFFGSAASSFTKGISGG
jgi:hypothetical protein